MARALRAWGINQREKARSKVRAESTNLASQLVSSKTQQLFMGLLSTIHHASFQNALMGEQIGENTGTRIELTPETCVETRGRNSHATVHHMLILFPELFCTDSRTSSQLYHEKKERKEKKGHKPKYFVTYFWL